MKGLTMKRTVLWPVFLWAALVISVAVDGSRRSCYRPRPSTNQPPAEPGPMRRASIAVGALAPEFDLPLLRAKGRVRLSSYRGRLPVVLAFGNFSCWVFDDEIRPLASLGCPRRSPGW
jgi:hypothetical protein